jgi:regulator of protease activity HflC (stomatin/prohibitin superfamily)
MDRIHYEHSLKEVAYDVPPQECITKDNVSVEVDGILYIKILDPAKTSYGIDNYLLATTQLAKTTLRSEIGKLNLDDTFSERESINQNVVRQVDHATDAWGIKVTRYEIKNITPPKQVLHSMEQQMRAEREKRAKIIAAEGELLASQKLAETADVMAAHPIALQLRNLQTMAEISVEKNSTIIFPAQFMSTITDIKAFMSQEQPMK